MSRIIVEGGRAKGVELDGGERFYADTVVSNADIKKTFLELVGEQHISAKTAKRVSAYKMAIPIFSVYLGLDIDLRGKMPATNYWVYSDFDIEGIYRDCYQGRLPKNPPLYITSASVKDPLGEWSSRSGGSSLEVMTFVPPHYSVWNVNEGPSADERYSRSEEYRRVKDEFTELVVSRAKEALPYINGHIVWQEASTPITHERYTLASGGTSYGIELSARQFGPFRPKPKTEINGLYLAGASTIYAHGIAGVMSGGVGTASAILKRNLMQAVREGTVLGHPQALPAHGPEWDPSEVCRRMSIKKRRGLPLRGSLRQVGVHEPV